MTRFWAWLVGDLPPHQQDVRDRFLSLPTIPEADRMCHGEKVRKKPRSFEEWNRTHGQRRAG
jgi:hypothetical protein